MSAPIIVLILAAMGLVGFGAQILSLHLHRVPVDNRRLQRLAFSRLTKQETAHSAELRRLVTVVSNSVVNDKSAQIELQQVFEQLGATTSPFGDSTASRKDRQRRSDRIEKTISDLEKRWNINP